MYRLSAVCALAASVTLTGCIGSHSATPTPAALPAKTYRDQKLSFSFRYPGAWSAAAHGHIVSQNGQSQYVVPINVHDSNVHLEVVVDGQLVSIPSVTPGKIGSVPGGATYRYYNMQISGYRALQGQRLFKQRTQVDDIETVVNTNHLSFNIRMLTVFPPFSNTATSGYNVILHSMKLPF